MADYNELVKTVGRSRLNSLYPQDFEAYIISFELVDSLGSTVEFFSLPIMPNSITINETELTSIKKTSGGVSVIKTDSFVPKDISLAGNFGRNFKVLIRDKFIDFDSFSLKGLSFKNVDFNGVNIKTGYGAVKAFKSILDGSKTIDSFGNPMMLYFYNFSFGENYVVEVKSKSFSQAKESSNGIWNYSIELKAVSEINYGLVNSSSLLEITSSSRIQGRLNELAVKLKKLIF